MLKFLGLVCLSLIFVASGWHKLNDPSSIGAAILSSPFPKFVKTTLGLPVPFAAAEATLLAQVIGGVMVGCGVLLVINLGLRRLAAGVLALMLIPITAFMHVNLADPSKTPQNEIITVLKNIAIFGGLLVVAGTGSRRPAAPATATKAAADAKKRA